MKKQKKAKSENNEYLKYGLTEKEIEPYHTKSNKNSSKAFKLCLSYYKNYRKYLFIIIFCLIVNIGLMLLEPILTEYLVNNLLDTKYIEAIKLGIFILLIQVVGQVINMLWDMSVEKGFQKTIRDLRFDLVDSVSRISMSKYNEVNSGAIVSRVTQDTVNVVGILDVVIGNIRDVIVSIGFIAYISYVNIWLGLLMIVMVLALSIFDNGLQRYSYKMGQKQKIIYERSVGEINEYVRGMQDLKLLNIRKNASQKFNKGVNYIHNISIDKQWGTQKRIRIRRSLEYFFAFLFILLGIYLLQAGKLMMGAFIVVVFYRSYAISLIQAISSIRTGIKEASISAERIAEILDDNIYKKEKFGNKTIRNPQGKIEFRNVSFSYKSEEILKDFNLKINPKQCIGIVGKSGQGKSTLVSLIPKLYEPQKGIILIDDVDIKTLSEAGLRELVVGVSQNPYIFNATIRENLKYVKPDLTDEKMIEVCKKVYLHDFIMSKPLGYDTIIGENGVILSGGQKQRLAIARALLKDSQIIIFDEATSALDNENQFKIQQTISELAKSRTVVVVAHRLSTIVNCDKIVFVKDGKASDYGTHIELMKACPEYKELYKIEEQNSRQKK